MSSWVFFQGVWNWTSFQRSEFLTCFYLSVYGPRYSEVRLGITLINILLEYNPGCLILTWGSTGSEWLWTNLLISQKNCQRSELTGIAKCGGHQKHKTMENPFHSCSRAASSENDFFRHCGASGMDETLPKGGWCHLTPGTPVMEKMWNACHCWCSVVPTNQVGVHWGCLTLYNLAVFSVWGWTFMEAIHLTGWHWQTNVSWHLTRSISLQIKDRANSWRCFWNTWKTSRIPLDEDPGF